MTKNEKIELIRNLREAYILYSNATRLPFVVCETETFYDQALIFESRTDAEECARNYCQGGDIVGVAALQTVEMVPPSDEKLGEPVKNLMRNQLREHLMRLPLMGVNAVFFKPEEGPGETLELDLVLPDVVKEHINKENSELSGVQLTGVYFAQYLRRQEKDDAKMREYTEEFYANLARAELLLPVIPEEEHADDPQLDLAKCKIPYYPIKRKDTDEVFSFLALFTNMDEVAAHCRNTKSRVKVVKMPFLDSYKFINDPMIGCVIDPLSINIPIRKEDIMGIAEAVKD